MKRNGSSINIYTNNYSCRQQSAGIDSDPPLVPKRFDFPEDIFSHTDDQGSDFG